MFILSFFRYISGYVRFTAYGGFLERFLNLCAKDHIFIWDGRRSGEVFTGYTSAKNYSRLRRHAKKAGVKLKLGEKHGVPFTRRKYRKRKGLLIGLVVFVAALLSMSRFIWRIEVNGGDIPESYIISALESIDIHPGKLRSSIQVRDSERRALLLIHDISWIALNVEGSTVYVEYSKSTPSPKMIAPSTPCNIIASASGQITSLDVFDGQPLVTEGHTVMAGDIIVSGITRDKKEQNVFVHARAKAIARTIFTTEIEIPFNQTEYIETGKKTSRFYLHAMGFEIPLFLPLKLPRPYYAERTDEPVNIFGFMSPFRLLSEEYTFVEEVPVLLDNEQARKQALLELASIEKIKLDGAKILEKNVNISTTSDIYTLTATYDCEMNIAQTQEIIVGGE